MVLVIAAHYDDEILGCGGLMHKLDEDVKGHFVGQGRDWKYDQKFDTLPILTITQAIEEAIARFKPEAVYTHWEYDCNEDHRIVYRATLAATRPQPGCPGCTSIDAR